MIAFTAADYRATLPEAGGRLLALDVGTKTIGLATCDTSWSFATPAETIQRSKFTADLAILRAFATRHSIVGRCLPWKTELNAPSVCVADKRFCGVGPNASMCRRSPSAKYTG